MSALSPAKVEVQFVCSSSDHFSSHRSLFVLTNDRDSVGEPGKPPCLDCYRSSHECILPESKRGGNYAHLRKQKAGSAQTAKASAGPVPLISESCAVVEQQDTTSSSRDELVDNKEPIYAELKNPLDALQILAQAAVSNESHSENDPSDQETSKKLQRGPGRDSFGTVDSVNVSGSAHIHTSGSEEVGVTRGIKDYPLVLSGLLSLETILMLLQL